MAENPDDKKRELYVAQARAKLKLAPEDALDWATQKMAYEADRDSNMAIAKKALAELTDKAIVGATDLKIADKLAAMQGALGRLGEDHTALVPGAKSEAEAMKVIQKKLEALYPGKEFPDLEDLKKKNKPFQSDIKTWTPEYVREEQLLSNAQFAAELALGELKKAEDVMKDLPGGDKMLENYRATAKAMGVEPPPELYVQVSDEGKVPSATSAKTREGRDVMVINASALTALNVDEQKALWAHELTHTINKDTTPEDMAKTYNAKDNSVYRKKEFAADAGAAALDAKATVAMLTKMKALDIAAYLKENPGKKVADYEKEHSDADHPSWDERIKRAEEAAKEKGKAPQMKEEKKGAQAPAAPMNFTVAEVTTNGAPLTTPVNGGQAAGRFA